MNEAPGWATLQRVIFPPESGVDTMSLYADAGPATGARFKESDEFARNTKPVEEKLSNALKTVLSDPEVVAQMERGGTIPRWLSPDDLAATIVRDEERWAAVIRDAGIRTD